MLHVPREIFELIPSNNINLYKTCQSFYYFIEVFYKQYKADMNRHLSDTYIQSILYIPKKSYDMKYICDHTYNMINYNPIYTYFDKLVHVELAHHFNSPLALPKTVTYFKMGNAYNHQMPWLPNLVALKCGKAFNQPLVNLATSLKILVLSICFTNDLILPPNLIELDTGSKYNFPLSLPNKLEYLRLGMYYKQPIILPDTLKVLKMYYYYNQILTLPTNLQKLYLSEDYAHYIDFSLINLTYLLIGKSYQHKLTFPSTLIALHIPKQYPHTINIKDLPLSLKEIRINMERININQLR